jgi:hypothetical protein
LVGGRLCTENSIDNQLWVNSETNAPSSAWKRYSLSAAHDRLWRGDRNLTYGKWVNDTRAFITQSYNSIVPIGLSGNEALIMYQLYRLPALDDKKRSP